MIEEFHSKEELYQRVYPVLRIKKEELEKQDIEITEEEIWKHLSKKWKDSYQLTLYDIVDDIMKYSPLNNKA